MSMESRPLARHPLLSSPGKPPAAAKRVVGREGQAVDGADDLRVRRLLLAGRRRWGWRSCRRRRGTAPISTRPGRSTRPAPARRRPRADSSDRPSRASATSGQGEVLHGVERGRVEPDEPHRLVGEHRPRAGGEVLQAGPDGEDDVGLGGQRVGRRAAGRADGPGVERVGRQQRGLAGDGLDDRDVVALGEGAQRLLGQRVVDAAAGDDQRLAWPRDSAAAARASWPASGRGRGISWTAGSKKRAG